MDAAFPVCLWWPEKAHWARHRQHHYWAIVAPDSGSDLCSALHAKGTDPMSSATQGRPVAPADRRWLVLVVVAIAQLMVVLDSTVVNIALPSAQRSLGFPNGDR